MITTVKAWVHDSGWLYLTANRPTPPGSRGYWVEAAEAVTGALREWDSEAPEINGHDLRFNHGRSSLWVAPGSLEMENWPSRMVSSGPRQGWVKLYVWDVGELYK